LPKWAVGAGEIFAGVATLGSSNAILAAVAPFLLETGIGTTIQGITHKAPIGGVQTSSINPIQPWNVVYGRAHVGGTRIYQGSFDENDKYLDLVYVVACHPCENVDQLLINGAYVPIDPTTRCSFTRPTAEYQFGDSDHSGRGHTLTTKFNRTAGIVTVTVTNSAGTGVGPYMQMDSGDKVLVDHMPSGGGGAALTLQGTFPVTLSLTNPNVFFYTSPGPDTGDVLNAGHITTVFADFKSKIYMENLLGTQTLGQTFAGMLTGTTYDGDLSHAKVTNPSNPWTAQHSGVGRTLVFIRLHYNNQVWASGLPQISFIVKGKNDIYDPRTGTTGWTDNAALCIADYLTQKKWGVRLDYVTDVPYAPLIAAANICDEAVSLAAGGTEPRYTCNGTFLLTTPRADILDSMLTCCAGRRTLSGGKWVIWPGAWQGTAGATVDLKPILTAPLRWRPKVKSRELFNAVKGTFISEVNSWQSSDYPAYLQNPERGFGTDNYLAQDGGERRYLDAPLQFTNSASMAQRIAKIILERHRWQGTANFTMDMRGYVMTALDVWPVDFDYTSFTDKQFEVQNARLTFNRVSVGDREVTVLGTEVDVQETDSSIYDWSPTEELTPSGYKQGVALSLLNQFPPTNLVLLSDATTALLQSNGLVKARILATWTDPTDGFFTQGGEIEIQYQLVSSPASPWNAVQSVLPGVQQVYIDGVQDGESYMVEIRSVNTAGVPSDWVVAGPVTVSELAAGLFGPNGGIAFPNYGDPLYPQAVAGLFISSQQKKDGSVMIKANVRPAVPANVLSTSIPAPQLEIPTAVATGGSIAGPQTLAIALVSVDSAGAYSALSDRVLVPIPSGSAASIPLTIDNYSASMVSYLVYVGLNQDILYYRYTVTAAATITLTSITPTSGNSYGMPDERFDHFVIGTTNLLLVGAFGGATSSLMTLVSFGLPGSHITFTFSGPTFTSGALVGRVLSFVYSSGGNQFPVDYKITGNGTNTITVLTPTPPVGWVGPAITVTGGDLACVRMVPTLSGGGNVVADSLLSMTTDQYKGAVLRMFFSDGSNQTSFIVTNDATSFTTQSAFTGLGPVWFWIESGSFSAMVPTTIAQDSAYSSSGVPIFAEIDNIAGFYGVQLFSADVFNNLSEAGFSPIRDIFSKGAAGANGSGGYFTVALDGSNHFVIDLANGKNQRVLLDTTTATGTFPNITTIATIMAPIFTGGTINAGDSFTLYIDQDPTGSWPVPVFNLHKSVTNPGFESGTLTPGWSVSPGPSSVVTAQSHSGTYAAQDATSGNVIYQDVTGLVSGQQYVIEAWLLATASGAGNLLLHDTTGANVVTGPSSSPTSWTRITQVYTANSTGAVRIHLKHNATTDPIFWDDVSVYEINGYAADTALQGIAPDGNTRSSYIFTWHGTVWGLDSFRTGGAIS